MKALFLLAWWMGLPLIGQSENRDPPSPLVHPDTGVVQSQRLAGGVPLGGIGCGAFEIRTDGTVSRATIHNNWDQPTGDLPGCFAAVWTNAGGRITARALQLKNGYGLPPVAALDYRGLFPQAFLTYPDPALPLSLSLRAHSALIPHDLKNSALPAALFVFTLKNESRGPVEASIALSWENFLGVGGTATTGPFADRSGNTVQPVPSTEGIFGLRFSCPLQPSPAPPDRLRYNARGTGAILVQPATPDAQVTMATWNVLDVAPGWWAAFAREGVVTGTVGVGQEGSVHPAGVVAVKVPLRDGETREIPFVFAWHTPRHYTLSGTEHGHLYEKSFADAVEVGRYVLENRLSLAALTDEWQNRLLRSSLPPWLIRRLINDTATLFTNTILTRDSGQEAPRPGPSLFALLESPSEGRGALGALDHRALAHGLLLAWFPALDRQELRQFKALQAPSGAMPRLEGYVDEGIGGPRDPDRNYGREDSPEVAAGYIFQVYRTFLWTGDQPFLDEFYPSAKHLVEYMARQDRDGDGLPDGLGNGDPAATLQTVSPYRAILWLAALQIARRMAAVMSDRRFEAQCAEWFDKARARDVLPSSLPPFLSASTLAGQWMADVVEAGDLLLPERSHRILDDLIAQHDKKSPIGLCEVTHAVAYQAALLALRGRPDAGLAWMQRIDHALVERARSPWQVPLWLRADNGQSVEMGQHLSAPASWHYLYALTGFSLDLPQARMTLAPRLPTPWKSLTVPLFAPGFWAWMDWRPGPTRARLAFRLDRMIPTAGTILQALTAASTPQEGAGLVLRQIVLPNPGFGSPQVTASLGRAPAPGKVTPDAQGRLLFTFETPIKLTAGQRVEFTLFAPADNGR